MSMVPWLGRPPRASASKIPALALARCFGTRMNLPAQGMLLGIHTAHCQRARSMGPMHRAASVPPALAPVASTWRKRMVQAQAPVEATMMASRKCHRAKQRRLWADDRLLPSPKAPGSVAAKAEARRPV